MDADTLLPSLQETELAIYDAKIEMKELKKDIKLMKDFLNTSDKVERANDLDNKVKDAQYEIKQLKTQIKSLRKLNVD